MNELRAKKIADYKKVGRDIDPEELYLEGPDAELIQLFGKPGEDELDYISVKDFFEKVRQYYPIVCSNHLCEFISLRNCEIIVDGCTGYETNAWRNLIKSANKISISPHGDETNPYLNAADLILRWIDEELTQSGIPLNNPGLHRILHYWTGVTEELETSHIILAHLSNKDLNEIKPISKRTMAYFEHIYRKHPVYFVILEEQSTREKEKVMGSPAMDVIINQVYLTDGSYCFWNQDKHSKYTKKGDVFVVYGNNGAKEAKSLLELQHPASLWDIRE